MEYAVLFLPLAASLIVLFSNRIFGDRFAQIITTAAVFAAAVCAALLFKDVAIDGHGRTMPLFTWISSGALQINWAIRLDTISAIMLVVVTFVSALVHLYSIGYMAEDKSIPRFMAYLSLFTFMMLALVTADNFIQMFFGWEGVGLASYLLIGFWYEKKSANAAAIKAFVVNRVGDFGFMLGILTIFFLFGTLQFDQVFAVAPNLQNRLFDVFGLHFDALTLGCLLLFIGAVGKSAQLGLHTWLPDAMEGPTPVSALIHAATMVTAGVVLLVRISPLLEQAPVAGQVIAVVGALTAFVGATIGLVQFDIKKVVAYSTMSQLGYMVFAAGLGAYGAAMFHLFTHAFFKALLFLGAGSVIHAMHHEQDMRHMGGLARYIPFTYAMMWIGSLALMGIPFFAGYYSKDMILEAAFARHSVPGLIAFILGLIAAFMTALYSAKLIFMTFHGARHDSHGDHHAHNHGHDDHHHEPHESPLTMTVPLLLLSLGALFAGYLFKDYFIGEKYLEFWHHAVHENGHHVIEAAHHVPGWVPLLPLVMAIGGLVTGWFCYSYRPETPARAAEKFKGLYITLVNKWFFDAVYDRVFGRGAFKAGAVIWDKVEDGTIDAIGARGSATASLATGKALSWFQSGAVYQYAFVMLIGLVGFIGWLAWRGF